MPEPTDNSQAQDRAAEAAAGADAPQTPAAAPLIRRSTPENRGKAARPPPPKRNPK